MGKKISFVEAEDEDLIFWAEKPVGERMKEMTEWNKKIWITINGNYPEVIEKDGGKIIKSDTDEDDF